MKEVIFQEDGLEQYEYWVNTNNKKILKKIGLLTDNIKQTPFSGLGKPEPLKGSLTGLWSRRITKEHRLVYKIQDNAIIILQCKFHY
jgi:toxin YoeB